jgi:hypothetical protein
MSLVRDPVSMLSRGPDADARAAARMTRTSVRRLVCVLRMAAFFSATSLHIRFPTLAPPGSLSDVSNLKDFRVPKLFGRNYSVLLTLFGSDNFESQ